MIIGGIIAVAILVSWLTRKRGPEKIKQDEDDSFDNNYRNFKPDTEPKN